MTSRILNEDELFNIARQIDCPELRQSFLSQACGDDGALRRRVEQFLQAHVEDQFLENGPELIDVESTNSESESRSDENEGDLCGESIGPYKLLEVIGEGGMGTVYMAEQIEPIRRRVAIKAIKIGMDTRQVIARFEAERQALARMDHPNIAKVLDAGATESGRPYFVMELVKGVPITKFCDLQQFSVEQRLGLFQQVCHAVQHAHQKGIIHRDIKPSNVLVAMYDEQPIAKVIDFGVAKAIEEPLTEKTMFTRFGQVVGTLEYMSPEQAQFNQLDIDTRSDIYSLGAILYELLAGQPPFDADKIKSQPLEETLRMIREDEPTKPSVKLGGTAESDRVAAMRRTSLQRLDSEIRGELDWIVIKALNKERSRRYETANSFAQDIRRYLNNEPVTASPPSLRYRFRKFSSRNRTLMTLLLLSGSGLIIVVAILAVSNNMILRRERDKITALQLAQENEQAAKRNLDQAEQNLNHALNAVDRLLTRVPDRALLNTPGMELLRKQLYEDALDISQTIAASKSAHASARKRAALAMFNVAKINQLLGDLDTADAAYLKSIDRWKKCLEQAKDPAERYDCMARLAGIYQNRSSLLADQGDPARAFELLQEASQIRERLTKSITIEDDPQIYLDLALGQINHAELLQQTGELQRAAIVYEKGISLLGQLTEILEDEADYWIWLAWAHGHMASGQRDMGQTRLAREHFEKSLAILTLWASEATNQGWARLELAYASLQLGRLLKNSDLDEARKHLQHAIDEARALCEQFPGRPDYSKVMCDALVNLGSVQEEYGEFKESRRLYEQSIQQRRLLVDAHPDVPEYQSDLAWGLRILADLLHDMGKRTDAEEAAAEEQLLREKLAVNFASFPKYRQALATSYESAARDLARFYQDFEKAEEIANKAIPVLKKLIDDFPQNLVYSKLLADTHGLLGAIHLDSRDAEAAKNEFKQGLVAAESIAAEYPMKDSIEDTLVRLRGNLATSHCLLREWDDAAKIFSASIEFFRGQISKHPHEPVYKLNCAETHANLGRLYVEQEKFRSAEGEYEIAQQLFESLADGFPDNKHFKSRAIGVHYNLACLFARKGDDRRAIEELKVLLKNADDSYRERIQSEPDLDSLRDDQRFKELLAK